MSTGFIQFGEYWFHSVWRVLVSFSLASTGFIQFGEYWFHSVCIIQFHLSVQHNNIYDITVYVCSVSDGRCEKGRY